MLPPWKLSRVKSPRYFLILAAACLTFSTLLSPVAFRMVSSFVSARNCAMGLGRFLFSVSPRFCCISPFFGAAWSRCRPSSPGSFMIIAPCFDLLNSSFGSLAWPQLCLLTNAAESRIRPIASGDIRAVVLAQSSGRGVFPFCADFSIPRVCAISVTDI